MDASIHTHLLKILPQHLTELRGSGLSDETIVRNGYYSVISEARIKRLLGWHPGNNLGPCLAIPYLHAPGFVRLKPDRPRAARKDKPNKKVKYESPVGSGNRAYFPPGTRAVLADPTVPLVITEGEKKAAKADQEGYPCVGLVGVYGWQRARRRGEDRTHRELIEDLRGVAWRDRVVWIVYDSDAADKVEVQHAAQHLAEALAEHGADARVAFLPAGPEGKVGLDDFLVAHANDVHGAMRRVFHSARLASEPMPSLTRGPARPAACTDGDALFSEFLDSIGSPANLAAVDECAAERAARAAHRAVAEQIRRRHADEHCSDPSIAVQKHRTRPEVAERFLRCGKCPGCRRHKVRRWIDNATFRLTGRGALATVFVGIVSTRDWPKCWGRIAKARGQYLWARIDNRTRLVISTVAAPGLAEVASAEALARFKFQLEMCPDAGWLAGSSRAWQIPKVPRVERNEWETVGRGCKLLREEAKDHLAALNHVQVVHHGPDAEPPARVCRSRRYIFPPVFTRYQRETFLYALQSGLLPSGLDVEDATEPIPPEAPAEDDALGEFNLLHFA